MFAAKQAVMNGTQAVVVVRHEKAKNATAIHSQKNSVLVRAYLHLHVVHLTVPFVVLSIISKLSIRY